MTHRHPASLLILIFSLLYGAQACSSALATTSEPITAPQADLTDDTIPRTSGLPTYGSYSDTITPSQEPGVSTIDEVLED